MAELTPMNINTDQQKTHFTNTAAASPGLFLIPRDCNGPIEYIPFVQSNNHVNEHDQFLNFVNTNHLQILQSCNGLLLCSNPSFTSHYIYSLSTNQHNQLTLPTQDTPAGLALAYNPNQSPHYKVVCIRQNKKSAQIAIYSSESNTWTNFCYSFNVSDPDINFKYGVYCNGAIHWHERARQGLYFDVPEECMREMPEPPIKYYFEDSREYFGQSQGHLYYVVLRPHSNSFDIYEIMEDYSSGCVFKCRIKLEELEDRVPSMCSVGENRNPDLYSRFACDVLCVVCDKKGKDKEISVVMCTHEEIVAYKSKENTITKVCDRQPYQGSLFYRINAAHLL